MAKETIITINPDEVNLKLFFLLIILAQTYSQLGDDISGSSLSSKLVLLNIHFPQLRILWSSSPFATAEIFEVLKHNQPQPEAQKAATIGVDPTQIGSDYNFVPREILRRLPGITEKNHLFVLSFVKNLKYLGDIAFKDIEHQIGSKPAKLLLDFIHTDLKDSF